MSGPWGFDLTETVSNTKTQSATANIVQPVVSGPWGFSLTENTSEPTVSGPWGFNLTENTPLCTQSATARLTAVLISTQTATANISDWYVDANLPADSQLYDDFDVTNGSTYQYRVVPIMPGYIDGEYITSNEITYAGPSGGARTTTQSALARIATSSVNGAGMMMGINF